MKISRWIVNPFDVKPLHGGRLDSLLTCLLVFALSIGAFAPQVFGPLSTFDEGFVASGAMLIRRGWLPIRDFYLAYGPGQIVLTAQIYEWFGENLLYSRALHLVLLGLLMVNMAWAAMELAPERPMVYGSVSAAGIFLTTELTPNSGYPSVTAVLLLISACLVLARSYRDSKLWLLVTASVMVGFAGLFRWDFGCYGLAAMVLAALAIHGVGGVSRQHLLRNLALGVMPGAIVMLVVMGPMVIQGGMLRWLDEVPRYFLLEFRQWRELPFVRPRWESLVTAMADRNIWTASRDALRLIFAALPFVVAPVAAVVALMQMRAGHLYRGCLVISLALMSAMLLNQMRVRSGFPQGYPAVVASLPLCAYIASFALQEWPRRISSVVVSLGALALVLIPVYVWQGQTRQAFGAVYTEDLNRAGHLRLPRGTAEKQALNEYAAMISHVVALTNDGDFIASLAGDHSRLFANDAMIYFLSNRRPATRWMEMEPGLTNTVDGQREVMTELDRAQAKVVIQWNYLSKEPNGTSVSNGVHLLDDYIANRYVLSRRFGDYVVLRRIAP